MRHFILLLAVVLTIHEAHAQSRPTFAMGVNLDNANAFVNIVKHTARYSKATGYDSLGWPTSDFDLVLLDGRPATEWNGAIDDPERYRIDNSGRYEAQFTGQANVAVSGTSVSIENLIYTASTNITTFDVVVGGRNSPNHGLVFLSFTQTRRVPLSTPNSGITGLSVNRPGYLRGDRSTFTDAFLKLCAAADFACYRFYNVQNIWDGEPTFPAQTTWHRRKTPDDAAQVSMASLNGKRDGWCWEYIVELGNTLKKDIWVNIHMSCDSTYVTSLAAMLQRDLDPSINIYVESSNEVWSPTQLTHGPYNAAEAASRGITFDDNHAHRTVLLSKWFATVFGQGAINNRIRVIMAGQHAYHGRSDNHLRYIQRTFGEPKNFIYATSTALYFGSTKDNSPDPSSINDGMLEDINDQIVNPSSPFYRLNHINKADQWQLVGGSTSYEGGPHMPAGGGTVNLGPQILSHRTEAMSDVLKANYLAGWRDLDGGLAMYFTLASGYNRYGCWGITDDPSEPDRNHKMQALRDIIGTSTNVADDHYSPSPLSITYNSVTNEAMVLSNDMSLTTSDISVHSLLGSTMTAPLRMVNDHTIHIDLNQTPRGLYVVRIGTQSSVICHW
ncbi:MAG: hypothetical protein IPI24_06890 [Ignavibacteria bacterium]|nr:hypothetical protein [Ignavibacteria bacterium]MBK6419418.1 hypothetical protein [Ignavibacteria bacterium]MBK7413642.1 hypothetical protein [Ignavibacteria bacterium]MBK7577142.1 hypothetical protein [Ignavibacteria bacterium]